MSDSHLKSVVKGISWRLVGSLDTFILSFLIIGQASVAASIAFVELFTKVFLYWLHERLWLKINF